MTSPFHYSTTYMLDKSHFSETFDESMQHNKKNVHPVLVYLTAIGLVLVGLSFLMFTQWSRYGAWFIVVLGCVDALSVYFKKPWWLARQMISQAANTELTLTIDENGVSSESTFVQSTLLWSDIHHIEKTKRGWFLHHKSGRNYLSSRCLSDLAERFLAQQASISFKKTQ